MASEQAIGDQDTHVILITEDSMQSSLLRDVLQSALGIQVLIVTPAMFESHNPVFDEEEIQYLLVDVGVFDEQWLDAYSDFKALHYFDVDEILLNCDPKVTYAELWIWRSLVGVFYASDDITVLKCGIEKIIAGEMWLSRKVAQDYILALRQQTKPVCSPTNAKLTKREYQIISLLSDGASNCQIASALTVSENTVKTHLHNIFKKIKAKNRVQALLWAKDHLNAPIPPKYN
ncbi:LuxR C-terminal-related transcriptional regulator [Vibrio maerlii]|uniref:LuxR C-terminal-related transcriptional regulator n=1 Tax=Vibrio maerlii TaxID=2231648 RepID=UPI0013E02951|nr:LuxR C-terminal-related transcriptional regulator [Vibrio maerlii]